jgi:uncharacterized membrane protein YdbT with pleckstrin-like domain
MAGSGFELMPGEKMVLFARPHWWYFWKQAVGGLIVIVLIVLTVWAGGWLATTLQWLTTAGVVVWLAYTVIGFVEWRTTMFAVTDLRVAYQTGFFRRKGVSIPLNRVNNVNFEQSFVARLTHNGIVIIESAGETGDSVFENIPEPSEVRRIIFQQMSAYETADSERGAAALAKAMRDDPSTQPAASVEGRLAELARLRDAGVISDEEYAAKRAEILGSL